MSELSLKSEINDVSSLRKREKPVRLNEFDFEAVANYLRIEVAVLKAVQEVETGGRGGFFAPGKPAILFEGHVFWRQLNKKGINPLDYVVENESILYPKWTKEHYGGGLAEYQRLEQAILINREAALLSASWGMFQIMGFNYSACGQKDIISFVEFMKTSELDQLYLSANFMEHEGMVKYLKAKDWVNFAIKYNGSGYAANKYDERLAEAYKKYSTGKMK